MSPRVDLDAVANRHYCAKFQPPLPADVAEALADIPDLAAELRAHREAVGALDEIRRLYLDLTAKGQYHLYVTRSYDVAMRALAALDKAAGP